MPIEDRRRLEKLLVMLDPDLYEQVYLPFQEGEKTFHEIIIELKKEKRNKILHLFNESFLTIAQKESRFKKYNLSQVADVLEVPRQTIYYWINKGWIKPKRDSRQYPFFTVFDIKGILKWRDKVNLDKLNRKFIKNRRFVQHSLNI